MRVTVLSKDDDDDSIGEGEGAIKTHTPYRKLQLDLTRYRRPNALTCKLKHSKKRQDGWRGACPDRLGPLRVSATDQFHLFCECIWTAWLLAEPHCTTQRDALETKVKMVSWITHVHASQSITPYASHRAKTTQPQLSLISDNLRTLSFPPEASLTHLAIIYSISASIHTVCD